MEENVEGRLFGAGTAFGTVFVSRKEKGEGRARPWGLVEKGDPLGGEGYRWKGGGFWR